MSISTDQIWDEISDPSKIPRDGWHRPLVVPPNGGKPVPYTRVTTFARAIEDMYGLGQWQQRMVAVGLAKRPDLLLAVSAHEQDKDELNRLIEAAKEAAKASAAATLGQALHKIAERYDRGELALADVPDSHRPDLEAYVVAMKPLTIHGIEEFVVLDDLQIGGTFDRIVEYDSRRYIADIKTGSIEYGATAMAVQLALYSRGWLYQPGKTDRGTTGVSQTAGLIIHLPAGQGRCDPYWINLRAGWEAVELCERVRAWRKTRGLLAAAALDGTTGPVSENDQAVEELIQLCDTPDDLAALWAAHRSTWTDKHTAAATARKKHLHQRRLRDALPTTP